MKKPNHSGSGQIRIIGGQWRGRKLPVPDSPGLRPTTDRVRETLFNWLAPVMVDAHCLDCFAGSGALGLEALSRYAANATLLEMDRAVSQQLQKNLAAQLKSIGGIKHGEFRRFFNGDRTFERSVGFIDGDLISRFLSLTPAKQSELMGLASKSTLPEKITEISKEELCKLIESLSYGL